MPVQRFQVRLDALPPFSPVVARLLEELSGEVQSFRRLSLRVSEDPALAAQVLRLANSALYGRRGEVSSLLVALNLIGTDRLRALVLTYGVRQLFRPVARLPLARRIWRHSLAASILAADFGMDAGSDAMEDYTAGLLHDLGRLVFLACAPEAYPKLVEQAGAPDACLELELACFGMTHAEAGAHAIERYRMPRRLSDACALHHAADLEALGRENPAAALVASCCHLASSCGFGVTETNPEESASASPDEPDDLALYIRERMEEIEAGLGLA
ncbi:MAG: HDOD domain-containing protein [Bryobacteraceae bacterium]|nr:HDOD domain-containing protein [Bryobacteraceae bacterium]MCX7603572.1 HDOD domain-containing protein [Bryobacteraceae bacterium]